MGYRCIGCQFPITTHQQEEVVSVFIRNGKREEDTLQVGFLTEHNHITASKNTEKYSSLEQLETVNQRLQKDFEKNLRERQYYMIYECSGLLNEEWAKTGFSVWHLDCALRELDVDFYVQDEIRHKQFRIEVLEEQVTNTSPDTYDHELIQEDIQREKEAILKLEQKEFNVFDNPFLKKKFRHFNKWNQNIVSNSGSYYGDTFFDHMKNQFLQFYRIAKSQDHGMPYLDNQMNSDEEEWDVEKNENDYTLAETLLLLGIPKSTLEEALALYNEKD